MNRPLIIGFGNPLRRDDGIGWRAAELLEAAPGVDAEVIVCHQLTPELAANLRQVPLVIFLDASAETAPGQVCEADVEAAEVSTFTHYLNPAQLLGLARCLGQLPPRAVLITCGVAETGMGETLSPSAEAGARQMAERVREILAKA